MKNKHYDKIVAKAANMELVVFFNPSFGSGAGKWEEATTTLFPAFHPDTEYFLCLPQHKEACLHWLNGGDAQQSLITDDSWVTSADVKKVSWMPWTSFMKDELKFRIKPKKEKRWIGYCANRNQTFPHPQKSKELAWDYAGRHYSYPASEWQVIEIEVEV